MAYAQVFGKHGSGDADFDEYVRALQHNLNGLVIRRILNKSGNIMKYEGEHELYTAR